MKLFLNLITYGLAAIGLFVLSGTLLLVVYLIVWSQPVDPQPVTHVIPTPIPVSVNQYTSEELWEVVNIWRLQSGYQSYIPDNQLCAIARQRVEEIKTDWSHNGFIRHANQGDYTHVNYVNLGENLARGFEDETETLLAWLNSPTHRENLEYVYTHSCIVASSTERETYAVQIFARYL